MPSDRPAGTRRLLLLAFLSLVGWGGAVDSLASGQQGASKQSNDAASAVDWTRRVAPDAAMVVRCDSFMRFRRDIESFVSAVNPLAAMMMSGMTAQLQNNSMFLGMDAARPLAIVSMNPSGLERGGMAILVPLDDEKLFAEGFTKSAEADLAGFTLVVHEGYAVIVSDPKLTPEVLFADGERDVTPFSGTLSASVRLSQFSSSLDKAMKALERGALGGEEMPEGSQFGGLIPQVVELFGALTSEVDTMAFEIDVAAEGASMTGRMTPAKGSALAACAAKQKPTTASCRGVGEALDLLQVHGRLDWRPVVGSLGPFLEGMAERRAGLEGERAESFARQITELASQMSGEFAMSVGFDSERGFEASQVFEVADGAAVAELVRSFAEDPTWLHLLYSSGEDVRFPVTPSKIGETQLFDYRLESGGEESGAPSDPMMPGVLVGTPSSHLVVTLGGEREAAMRRELGRLSGDGKGGAASPVEGSVPAGANVVMTLSLVDYMSTMYALMPQGSPLAGLAGGRVKKTGKGKVAGYASIVPERVEAGLRLPTPAVRDAVNFVQQAVTARMMQNAAARRPAQKAAPEPGSLESFIGNELPDVSWTDLDGKAVSLSSLRGKVVLLDFWAGGCPPCHRGVPIFNELQRDLGERGLEVVGISEANESAESIAGYVKERSVSYRMLRNGGGLPEPYSGIISFPTTLVIDREGKLRSFHVGFTDKSEFVKQIEPCF